MKTVSVRHFARVLAQHGWVLQRVNGSHHIYVRPGLNIRLVVPVHGNADLKRGLQNHLMKLAELTDDDL